MNPARKDSTGRQPGIFRLRPIHIATLGLLALVLLFPGCENAFGVYDQIQSERKQSGTDTFKNTSVRGLADDGASFYAAMAKVYTRDRSAGSAWSLLSISGSGGPETAYFANGIAGDGTDKVWIAASDPSSGTFLGVFEYSRSGASWTVYSTGLDSLTVDALYQANGTLFASVHKGTGTDTTYGLYYLSLGSFVSALDGASTDKAESAFIGVFYDTVTYWAATSKKVYTGNLAAMAVDSDAAGPTGKSLGGLAMNSVSDILVSTSGGDLYSHAKGGAWSHTSVKSGASLGDLVELPSSAGNLLAIENLGSTRGYFEYRAGTTLEGGASNALLSPIESDYATAVSGKPINAFLYVPATSPGKDTLLIGLSAQGSGGYSLYSNVYESSTWSGWEAE